MGQCVDMASNEVFEALIGVDENVGFTFINGGAFNGWAAVDDEHESDEMAPCMFDAFE
jgi:predicted membrane GTPase involved in stress response